MSSNTVVNVKWLHCGTLRRFQIDATPGVDIYKTLLQKVNAVVPNFIGEFAWEGNLLSIEVKNKIKLELNINI